MAGMKKGSGTRSGLLWEVERILQELVDDNLELPDCLMLENVPQVISAQNIDDFHEWNKFLESIGYRNYGQLLNAKDYGIPQNRLRYFQFSFLGDYYYDFPQPIPLEKCIEDILEDEVQRNLYLKEDQKRKLFEQLLDNTDLMRTILTRQDKTRQDSGKSALTEVTTSQNNEKSQMPLCQDRTEVSATTSKRVTVSLNLNEIDGQIDIAHTLCARDYKGLRYRQSMNGVLEIKGD